MKKNAKAIVVKKICKSFGKGEAKIDVLHHIDWQIDPGKITFLVGPSGCGKTTLISIIAGILTSTSGSVSLFGDEIAKMKNGALTRFRRDHIGFIFQQFNLLPALTAAENVSVPLVIQGVRRGKALKRARELLAKVGLEKHMNALPKQLSGGQQQRIAVARALIHDPTLLVCDEPTASLDHESGEQIMQLLTNNAKQKDRCVIVVTHDSRIFHYADVMTYIDDGRISKIVDNGKRP